MWWALSGLIRYNSSLLCVHSDLYNRLLVGNILYLHLSTTSVSPFFNKLNSIQKKITIFPSSSLAFVLLWWGLKLRLNTFYHRHLHLHKASGLCHPGYTVWRYLYVHSPIKVYQPREGDWRERGKTQRYKVNPSYLISRLWNGARIAYVLQIASFPGLIPTLHSLQSAWTPSYFLFMWKRTRSLCDQ